ncbi:MAG: tetratricopeptide repeat protein [Rhizomicrobium sp.]
MHIRRLAAAFFAISISAGACIAADDKAQTTEPVTAKLITHDVQVAADGSSIQTVHAELRASNDAAAMQISQVSFPFDASMQDVQVVEAHTLKPDGTTVAVDASAIFEQLPPGQPQIPMFTGQRVKVIVFPQFAAGDTAVYTVKITAKHPFFEGQFFYGDLYPRTIAFDEVRETITAPKTLPLYVENHEVEFSKHETATDVTYMWHYSAPTPSPDEFVEVSPLDHVARFFVSSFKDYAELGRAYAGLAAPKAAVTPKISALADQITNGVSDRREQAKKIYEWVSGHIRYVAIELGKGSFVPHDVDSIVANGYGDCKDHDVLLQTLLKAKGIDSKSVLINGNNAYTLTQVPTFAQLNHVITFVPELNLYLDSSAFVAPFGVLPINEYGKPIVSASASEAALGIMPVLPPGASSVTTTTVSHLDKDGQLTGTTTTTAVGPYSITLRTIGLSIQAMGTANAASQILKAMGYTGASGDFTEDSPVDLSPSYTITAKYTFSGWADEVSGASSFYLPGGLRLLGLTGDGNMGPFNPGEMKDSEPTPCFSAHDSETLSLQAPPGMQFSDVPKDTLVETANLKFTAHWSLTDNTLTVHRDFTSTIDQPLCTGEIRKQAAAALKQISDSYNTNISFSRTLENADQAIKANPNDAEAFDDRGITHAKSGQNTLAITDYDQAIKLKPNEAQYYYNRGLAYSDLGQYVRAFEDFDKAVAMKPDDADFLENRGYAYRMMNQNDSALQDFDKVIALKPDYALAYYNRGAIYYSTRQFERAIQEYDQAIKLDPSYYYSYLDRGSVNLNLKEYGRAIGDFSKAITLNAADENAYVHRGMAYLDSQKFRLAIKDFDKAIALKPNSAGTYMMRSFAKRGLGDSVGANQDTSQAVKLDPKLGK